MPRATIAPPENLDEDQPMKYSNENFETKLEEEPKQEALDERISERRE